MSTGKQSESHAEVSASASASAQQNSDRLKKTTKSFLKRFEDLFVPNFEEVERVRAGGSAGAGAGAGGSKQMADNNKATSVDNFSADYVRKATGEEIINGLANYMARFSDPDAMHIDVWRIKGALENIWAVAAAGVDADADAEARGNPNNANATVEKK